VVKLRAHLPKRWVASGAAAAVAFFASAGFVLAILPGSTFEGSDGNLLIDTAGKTDWCNQPLSFSGTCPTGSLVPGFVEGIDLPSGTGDNAFGQGTKEDNSNVTVVTGSIPPNKNDLTRFYLGSEFVGGFNFLYLGWERAINIGNANLDFEISQHATAGFTASTTGPVTLNRTAGDVLVTYDFSGSGTPTLGLLRWVTSGATSQCFSSNTLPCWGNRVDLSAAGDAEGAVNSGNVIDPIAPNAPRTLSTGLFGEAAINLTAAGVFPANTCTAFGSTFLKSRSSSSFTAEIKDFIAPVPVNISNCGSIVIHKITQNGFSTFGYSTTGGLSPASFNLATTAAGIPGEATQTYSSVVPGGYSVTESTIPAGWNLVSLVCTASGAGTTASPSSATNTATASITMAAGGLVDCTYTNHTKVSPSITTALSSNPVSIGTPVTDQATLLGATATAGGTVTYSAYAGADTCTGIDLLNSTVTVTNGSVPVSAAFTPNNAGTYSFQAVYSGDGDNNSATSDCTTEQLVVNKNQPGISTAQNLLPNDSATLSGVAAGPGGTITFTLSDPTSADCSVPVYTQTITGVTADGTFSTSNTTVFAMTPGEWRWQIVYSGDSNNVGVTSACGVENFTIVNVGGK
jgi:hypothetical protein